MADEVNCPECGNLEMTGDQLKQRLADAIWPFRIETIEVSIHTGNDMMHGVYIKGNPVAYATINGRTITVEPGCCLVSMIDNIADRLRET